MWRNAIRLKALHSALFPGKKLHWRTWDQKPLHFNHAGGCRTLALEGAADVTVNENVHATRAHFSVMTKCVSKLPSKIWEQTTARSSGSADSRRLAVLFKAGPECFKRDLRTPEGVLVQAAPKGSYRVPDVLDYIKWDLGQADPEPGSGEVFGLAWFSAHLEILRM